MPNVRTVNHRDIHFINTLEDGHRVTIAKGVKGGQYEGIESQGRTTQEAYDCLLETKRQWEELNAEMQARRARPLAPTYCNPGREPHGCKNQCTKSIITGKIMDPDCFR